jgi:hypothetical protein
VEATADADYLFEQAPSTGATTGAGAVAATAGASVGTKRQSVTPAPIVRCPQQPVDLPIDLTHQAGSLQFLAPNLGVYNVRAAHSEVLLRAARAEYCAAPGGQAFFHFYLFNASDRNIPLNWILSEKTVAAIREELKPGGANGNAEELEALTKMLSSPTSR